jgi:hypothetical protein
MGKSLLEQANDLAYKAILRRLRMPFIEDLPTHGEKIEIPHPDKLGCTGEGESAIGGEGVPGTTR